MYCLNLKKGKSGHARMQIPITLCFKATQLLQAALTLDSRGAAYINVSGENGL